MAVKHDKGTSSHEHFHTRITATWRGGVSGQNKTVDIKRWTAVWILEQQSLMKSGDGAAGHLLHSQL